MVDKKLYNNVPQWLKESLNRGYTPHYICHDLDKYSFCYIKPNSNHIYKAPISKSIVLEGLPGAGKTTSVERFAKNKYVQTVMQILPFEPPNDREVDEGYYFNSEELKTKEIVNSNKRFCFLDRYYISVLAYNWAYDKINKTNNYNRALEWYMQAMTNRTIWQPFEIIYIDIDARLSLIRKNRNKSNSANNLWENMSFLKYFSDYYTYFFNEIEPQAKVRYLSSNLSLDEIEKILRSMIDER